MTDIQEQITVHTENTRDSKVLEGRSENICQWLFKNKNKCSTTHIQFYIYGLFSLSVIALYIYTESDDGMLGYFITCGITLLLSIYAGPSFRNILLLRDELRILIEGNIELRNQRHIFKKDIQQLQHHIKRMKKIRGNLNTPEKELASGYDLLLNFAHSTTDSTQNNVHLIQILRKELNVSFENFLINLATAERGMFDQIYQQIILRRKEIDRINGLSFLEFRYFLSRLPHSYNIRWLKLSLKKIWIRDYRSSITKRMDYKYFELFMNDMIKQGMIDRKLIV